MSKDYDGGIAENCNVWSHTRQKFPLRAIMTATRRIFIGNLDGLAALRQLTLTAPLQLAPITSSIRSLAHGSRSAFALDRGPWLNAGDQINVDFPLGHESSDNSAPSAKGFRINTAATDELKQQFL